MGIIQGAKHVSMLACNSPSHGCCSRAEAAGADLGYERSLLKEMVPSLILDKKSGVCLLVERIPTDVSASLRMS